MSVSDTLIPIINSLQDVFSAISTQKQTIDLPQIVVVGSQSAGKSSVLEAICGRDLLPRGSGIVTRRPLILQLNATKPGQTVRDKDGKEFQEWGEFQHTGDKKFIKFEEITAEIVAETDRGTGSNKGVSSVPINLRLFSPHVIPLTLVDLPGLVRNAINGQPKDIVEQIADCVNVYISRPNAIILAVCAANADLATADALCAAKRVDPDGNRTVGVLTKVDIVDNGTEANVVKILNNDDYALKLGWVAVQNRSQRDIDMNKPIVKHLKDEAGFFAANQYYKVVASRCGVKYLTKRLNQVLINHIQTTLPDIRLKVGQQFEKYSRELMSYDVVPESAAEKQRLLLAIIADFDREYRNLIEGSSAAASRSELVGGARISYIFSTVLPRMFDTVSVSELLQSEDVRTIIKNSSGLGSGMFISQAAFELLTTKILKLFELPCQQCLHLVKTELIAMARSIQGERIKKFKGLSTELVGIACGLIDSLSKPTGRFLRDMLAAELSFINTNHPDFIQSQEFQASTNLRAPVEMPEPMGAKGFQPRVPAPIVRVGPNVDAQLGRPANLAPDQLMSQPITANSLTETEKMAVEIIPRLTLSYCRVIRKKIEDTVSKACVAFLVKASKDQMQESLIRQLYSADRLDQLLYEDPVVREKRAAAREMVNVLGKAQQILEKIGDVRSVEQIQTSE